jgi:hypothetical protein
MKIIVILIGAISALVLLGWLGFKILPAPFPPFAGGSSSLERVPLPAGLPEPVDRYYRTVYGDTVPVIESTVVSGRGWLRPFGPIYFPGRFRFTHVAGQDYRHYIEITFFGIPLMKVNERYVDEKSLFEAPVGIIDDDPKQNQGANLGLWAESAWFPAIFITDPRVRWEPIDGETAFLIVPFENDEERFVVRFDPGSGLITYLESMRYKGPESESKTLWLNESVSWREVEGRPVPETGSAIWIDQRTPWAFFTLEEIVFNADVEDYVRQKGP